MKRRSSVVSAAGVTFVLAFVPGGSSTTANPPDQFSVIHDNGIPDGVNGYSNATSEVLGARRTLLDDFILEHSWIVNGLEHHAIWNTLPVGSGRGMEIAFRQDAGGAPGSVIAVGSVHTYAEEATGKTRFSRPEYVAWTGFDGMILQAGHYWLEATVVGPENNFWLTATPINYEECWVNYEDLGGLIPGSEQFGVPSDLAWRLYGAQCGKSLWCCFPDGTCEFIQCSECGKRGGVPLQQSCEVNPCPQPCPGDLDGSGAVDFGDVVVLLAAWGPCAPECPGDLDGDMMVGLSDLLIVLAVWGPCT